MRYFKELIPHLANKATLVIGKGPSYRKLTLEDYSNFFTIALNHVINIEDQVDMIHFIDFDVFLKCEKKILHSKALILMPYYPHFDNVAGKHSLPQLLLVQQSLNEIAEEGRLFWYNHIPHEQSQTFNCTDPLNTEVFHDVISVRYFSFEAVADILGIMGMNKITTLGIDGGSSYNKAFHFTTETLLSNGRESFDIQFHEVAKIISRHKIVLERLDERIDSIKVYVGSQKEQLLACKVLEYSIRRNTNHHVVFHPLYLSERRHASPQNPENRPRTPFSFQRFLIPEIQSYKDIAIYLDSDMLLLQDIAILRSMPLGQESVISIDAIKGRDLQTKNAVLVINCEKAIWNIDQIIMELDEGRYDYHQLMNDMACEENFSERIPLCWNSLDLVTEQTCLVHYTDMPRQPWLKTGHEFGWLWVSELASAINSEFIELALVEQEITAGNVRPSLLYQINQMQYDETDCKEILDEIDKDFVPYFLK